MPRRRLFSKPDTWEYGHDAPADERPLAKPTKRRAATMLVWGVTFFAGAAFAAVAGDKFAPSSTDTADSSALSADATTTTDNSTTADTSAAPSTDASATPDASSSADAAPTTDAPSTPAAAPASDATAPSDAAAAPADAAATDANAPEDLRTQHSSSSYYAASSSSASKSTPTGTRRHHSASRSRAEASAWTADLLPKALPAPKPELEGPAQYSTVWLNRALPDPTPPALRLSSAFARNLKFAAEGAGVDWSLLLGIVRAKGGTGHVPADPATLGKLAARLGSLHAGGQWATALAYDGSASFADRAQALARYDRAVGLDALVNGLEASKTQIAERLLADPAISIYPGGRDDIAKGKVDVRVLALLSYLHESFGEVTVSCLISGHRLYARPGVVSAHIYGRAIDIAALGGVPIIGHQQPGGITEQAVRAILQLPSEVMPKQVISLLGLGGPSFPLADHYNHIHVGY